MNRFFIILFLVFSLNTTAGAQSESFWEQQAIGFLQDYELVKSPGSEKIFFEAVHAHTQAILKRFPPSEWFYVSVGRSGAAIAADLKVMSARNSEIEIKTLAWSSLRENKSHIEARVVQFADEYLREYLPKTHKKVLFIDYAQTGDSVVSLNSFLKDIYAKSRYGFYLLLSPENGFALRFYLGRHLPDPTKFARLRGRDIFLRALQIQGLDAFAEYGRFPVKAAYAEFKGKVSKIVIPRNPAEQEFIDWFQHAHEEFNSKALIRSCRAIFSI